MAGDVFPFRLKALSPWAWHGLAVPSGTATLNDVVTDTAMAFAAAAALGMMPRWPCLPSTPDYRTHVAALPFKTTLFLGQDNRLNRPLARRLNLDVECGMPNEHPHRAYQWQHQGLLPHPGSRRRRRLLRLFPARGPFAHRAGCLWRSRRKTRRQAWPGTQRGGTPRTQSGRTRHLPQLAHGAAI